MNNNNSRQKTLQGLSTKLLQQMLTTRQFPGNPNVMLSAFSGRTQLELNKREKEIRNELKRRETLVKSNANVSATNITQELGNNIIKELGSDIVSKRELREQRIKNTKNAKNKINLLKGLKNLTGINNSSIKLKGIGQDELSIKNINPDKFNTDSLKTIYEAYEPYYRNLLLSQLQKKNRINYETLLSSYTEKNALNSKAVPIDKILQELNKKELGEKQAKEVRSKYLKHLDSLDTGFGFGNTSSTNNISEKLQGPPAPPVPPQPNFKSSATSATSTTSAKPTQKVSNGQPSTKESSIENLLANIRKGTSLRSTVPQQQKLELSPEQKAIKARRVAIAGKEGNEVNEE